MIVKCHGEQSPSTLPVEALFVVIESKPAQDQIEKFTKVPVCQTAYGVTIDVPKR